MPQSKLITEMDDDQKFLDVSLIDATKLMLCGLAKMLINLGADPNVEIDGECPIEIAIKNNDDKMVELLLDNGAEIKKI